MADFDIGSFLTSALSLYGQNSASNTVQQGRTAAVGQTDPWGVQGGRAQASTALQGFIGNPNAQYGGALGQQSLNQATTAGQGLQDFMKNPSSALQTPQAQAQLQAGQEAVNSSNAAHGFSGSGYGAAALQRQGMAESGQIMQQQFNNLSQLQQTGTSQAMGIGAQNFNQAQQLAGANNGQIAGGEILQNRAGDAGMQTLANTQGSAMGGLLGQGVGALFGTKDTKDAAGNVVKGSAGLLSGLFGGKGEQVGQQDMDWFNQDEAAMNAGEADMYSQDFGGAGGGDGFSSIMNGSAGSAMGDMGIGSSDWADMSGSIDAGNAIDWGDSGSFSPTSGNAGTRGQQQQSASGGLLGSAQQAYGLYKKGSQLYKAGTAAANAFSSGAAAGGTEAGISSSVGALGAAAIPAAAVAMAAWMYSDWNDPKDQMAEDQSAKLNIQAAKQRYGSAGPEVLNRIRESMASTPGMTKGSSSGQNFIGDLQKSLGGPDKVLGGEFGRTFSFGDTQSPKTLQQYLTDPRVTSNPSLLKIVQDTINRQNAYNTSGAKRTWDAWVSNPGNEDPNSTPNPYAN